MPGIGHAQPVGDALGDARPYFLVTIDVEGDNIWGRPSRPETRNADYLPAFQELCEAYGVRPTYLTNYEMAMSPVYREFARDVIQRDVAEVGMHLHAWDTPPLRPLTTDDARWQPYAIDYPTAVLHEKIRLLTGLLEQTFERKMVSHRAGRWSLNGNYAAALIDHRYLVDCSVTPHISWRHVPGRPGGAAGSDYQAAPEHPYFVNLSDVWRDGDSALLEVPVTVVSTGSVIGRFASKFVQPLGARAIAAAARVAPTVEWLRPDGRNRSSMLSILARKRNAGASHVEFTLHSSELMPGGSPRFRDEKAIGKLYEDIEAVFAESRDLSPATLAEFRSSYVGTA